MSTTPIGVGTIVKSDRMHGIFGTVGGMRKQHREGRGWGEVEYLLRNGPSSSWIDERQVKPATLDDIVGHYDRLLREAAQELAEAQAQAQRYRDMVAEKGCVTLSTTIDRSQDGDNYVKANLTHKDGGTTSVLLYPSPTVEHGVSVQIETDDLVSFIRVMLNDGDIYEGNPEEDE